MQPALEPVRARPAAAARPPARGERAPAAAPRSGVALARALGNRGYGRWIQPRLDVGPVDDPLEREADRAAEAAISGTPASVRPAPPADGGPRLRRCACGGRCPECRKRAEEEGRLRRDASAGAAPAAAPPIVHEVLGSTGAALDAGTRGRMNEAFGADFSGVRVHADARAARSADAVGAHAYAVGRDVVFAAGRYAPGTREGDRLIAHELAHVVQQSAGGTAPRVQRACGMAAVGATPSGCTFVPGAAPAGTRFLFQHGCDDFEAGQEALLRTHVAAIPATARIEILGMASSDGPSAFNHGLSCRRAAVAEGVVRSAGRGASISLVRAAGAAGPPGDASFRAVDVVTRDGPAPVPGPTPSAPAPSAPVPSAPVPSAPVPSAPVPSAPVPSAPVPSVPASPVPASPAQGAGTSACDTSAVAAECGAADANCLSVSGSCAGKDLDALEKKYRGYVASQSASFPNAAANLEHFLDHSGATRTVPSSLFSAHPSVQAVLVHHRNKFITGAESRLKAMPGAPTAPVAFALRFTSAGNAFGIPYTDLGLAVGGYQLCSTADVTATPAGKSLFFWNRYRISFANWTVQAFDCYNWDPGKGVPFVGNDAELCCLQNAGRGKHYLVRTDPWTNTHAPSLAGGEVSI